MEDIDIAELRIDESYWPKGSSEVMRRWLATGYDPATMPPLITSRCEDGYYAVVGWETEGTDWFPLGLMAHTLLKHPDDGSCECGYRVVDDQEGS